MESFAIDTKPDTLDWPSFSAFHFHDFSTHAEILDDGCMELMAEPLNDEGAVGGVKLVGVVTEGVQ